MEHDIHLCTPNYQEKDLPYYVQLCENPDADVRLEAAEALLMFPYAQTESLFLHLLHDSDIFVQCQACDALSSGKSNHVLMSLMDTAHRNNGMLCGYAVLSLADVQRNINTNAEKTIAFLLNLLDCKTDDWVRITIYRSLIVLGMDSYISAFLEYRKDSDYHNRCLMLNLLEEILDEGLYSRTETLETILLEMLAEERSLAAKETIQRILGT